MLTTNQKNSKIYSVSDEEFIKIINKAKGIKEVETMLGYNKTCLKLNNKTLNYRCNDLQLNIDKFKMNLVHNKTKGEIFNQRCGWQNARSAIQKTARRVYEKSEKDKKCLICGYKKHYEIAHIKSVSSFENNVLIEEINNISNLVALCPNHHYEFDNNLLSEEELSLIHS